MELWRRNTAGPLELTCELILRRGKLAQMVYPYSFLHRGTCTLFSYICIPLSTRRGVQKSGMMKGLE